MRTATGYHTHIHNAADNRPHCTREAMNTDQLKLAAEIILRECGYRVADLIATALDMRMELWNEMDEFPTYTVDDTTEDDGKADALFDVFDALLAATPKQAGYTSRSEPGDRADDYEQYP